jgi:hypothetical protein
MYYVMTKQDKIVNSRKTLPQRALVPTTLKEGQANFPS